MTFTDAGPPLFTILIVWYAICGLCAILLIGGTIWNSRGCLVPWLIKDILATIIAVVNLVYCCIHFNLLMVIIEPITIIYSIYFFLVVYCHYRKLASISHYGCIPSNTNQLSVK